MPQIGPLEILVVSVLALVVFGPDRLPDLARSAGKGLHQLRTMARDVRSEFDMGLEHSNTQEPETSEDRQSRAEAAIAEPAESGSSKI